MASADGVLTADQLLRWPDDEMRHELVEGRLTTMSPPGGMHGVCAARLHRALANHVESQRLGATLVEAGFKLKSDPDTVRAPDVSFVARSRVPRVLPVAYWEGPPNLAVEVKSPDQSERDVLDKVRDYLSAGARAVWVVRPRNHSVTRYRPGAEPVSLRPGDVLVEPDVVPGFRLQVESLFEGC